MKKSVLFVDDEIQILNTIRRLFRNETFELLTASSGAEALEVLKQNNVDLVVSDQRMPNMSGSEFLEEVNRLYPNTKRVMMSGFADIHAVVEAVNQGKICQFLTKPWNKQELKDAVFNYLEGPDSFMPESIPSQNELKSLIDSKDNEIMILKEKLEDLQSELAEK